MIYCYRCPSGHTFDVFRPLSQRNRKVKCPDCGKPAPRDLKAELLSDRAVIPDLEMHVNPSIPGSPLVKSRQHLVALQKQHGLSDYDRKSHDGPPSDWS